MFVTPLYAAILSLWFVVLSLRVMNLRRRGMPFGDNGDVAVARVVRAQANFGEYVPLALVMMGLLESGRHSIYVLHALGVTLVVARVLHGLALSFAWQPRRARVSGAALTIGVLIIEALLCLLQGLRGQWLWAQ